MKLSFLAMLPNINVPLPSCLVNFANYFAWFGVAASSYLFFKLTLSLVSGIKSFILPKFVGIGANVKKLGEWAVVTGSTDGIGEAYAHELARKGMKVVLISRSQDKLDKVKSDIESKTNATVKTIAIDFCGGLEIYDKIKKELSGLDIGVLVNNVGMSYAIPDYYGEVTEQFVDNIIKVNITSMTMLTRMVLPQMAEKRKGAIINLSSASAIQPTPLLTIYSATKAFAVFFSKALQTEYKNKNVTIQCVMPFFVATKMSGIRRSNLFVPKPGPYARAALRTLGVAQTTYGCMSHALQGWVVERINGWLYQKAILNEQQTVRRRIMLRSQRDRARVAAEAVRARNRDAKVAEEKED